MRLGTLVACLIVIAGCFGPTSPSDTSPIHRSQSPPPPPPPPATVRGVVTDSLRHNPVSGALIHWGWLAFGCGDPAGSASTNDDGAYTVQVGSNGAVLGQQLDVTICASKAGYKEHQESVRVTLDSSEVTVNFDLMPSDVEQNRARR